MPDKSKLKLPYTREQYLSIVRDQLPAVYQILSNDELERIVPQIDPSYPNYEFSPEPKALHDNFDTDPTMGEVAWQTLRNFYYRFPEQLAASALSMEILAQKLQRRVEEQQPDFDNDELAKQHSQTISAMLDTYKAARNWAEKKLRQDSNYLRYANWSAETNYYNTDDYWDYAKLALRDVLSGIASFTETLAASALGQLVAGPVGAAAGGYIMGYLLESSDEFQQVYQRAIDTGMSEEAAARLAGETAVVYGAASGVLEGAVPFGITRGVGFFNALREQTFGRFASKYFLRRAIQNKTAGRAAAEALAAVAEENVSLVRRVMSGLATLGMESTGEGATEVAQYIIQRALEDRAFGEELTLDKIKQYASEPEALSSFVGGLGSPAPFALPHVKQTMAGDQGKELAEKISDVYERGSNEYELAVKNVLEAKHINPIDKVAFARRLLELEGQPISKKAAEATKKPIDERTTKTDTKPLPKADRAAESVSGPPKNTLEWFTNPTPEYEPKGLKGSRPSTKLLNYFLKQKGGVLAKELKQLPDDKKQEVLGKLLLALNQVMPKGDDGKIIGLDLNSFRDKNGNIDERKVLALVNKLRKSKLEVGVDETKESAAVIGGKEELKSKAKAGKLTQNDILEMIGLSPTEIVGNVIDITGDMFDVAGDVTGTKPGDVFGGKQQKPRVAKSTKIPAPAKTQKPSKQKLSPLEQKRMQVYNQAKDILGSIKGRSEELYKELKPKVERTIARARNEETLDKIVERLKTYDTEEAASVAKEASKITMHSGGQVGSDLYWGKVAEQYGAETRHYYVEGEKTPGGNVPISKLQAKQADKVLAKVAEELGKTFPAKSERTNNLLRRNYLQVKNADAIYAVSTIQKNGKVRGGTGWAVQMAIDEGKPVYVFDQKEKSWFQWNYESNTWDKLSKPPRLTRNFAGIGARRLSEVGKKAIKDIFEQSFGRSKTQQPETTKRAQEKPARSKRQQAQKPKPKEIMQEAKAEIKKAKPKPKKEQPKPQKQLRSSGSSAINSSKVDDTLFEAGHSEAFNDNIRSFVAGVDIKLPKYDVDNYIPYYIPNNPAKELEMASGSSDNAIIGIRLDYLTDDAFGDSMRSVALSKNERVDGTIVYIPREQSNNSAQFLIMDQRDVHDAYRIAVRPIEGDVVITVPKNTVDIAMLSAKLYHGGREQREQLFDLLRNSVLPKWATQYLDPGAKNTTRDVLKKLAKTAYHPAHRKIAKLLLGISRKINVEIDWDYAGSMLHIHDGKKVSALGVYSVITNKIYISFDAINELSTLSKEEIAKLGPETAKAVAFQTTLLHEIVHAYTAAALHKIGGVAADELGPRKVLVRNAIKDLLGRLLYDARNEVYFHEDYYALTNEYELLAEALSSFYIGSRYKDLAQKMRILAKTISGRDPEELFRSILKDLASIAEEATKDEYRVALIMFTAQHNYRGVATQLYSGLNEIENTDRDDHNYEEEADIYRAHIIEKFETDPGSLLRALFIRSLGIYIDREQYAQIAAWIASHRDRNIFADDKTFSEFLDDFMAFVKEVTGLDIEIDTSNQRLRDSIKLWYQRVSSRIPVAYDKLEGGKRINLQVVIDQASNKAQVQVLSPIDLATERTNPTLEIENFIEEDGRRFKVNNTWMYLSFNHIYIKGKYTDQFGERRTYYRKARPGEAPISGKWVVQVMKDTLADGIPLVFMGEVSGDDSRMLFAPAKIVYMGKTFDDFMDYLNQEIEAGNMTEAHRDLFLNSYDTLVEVGYPEPAMLLMSYHDRMKAVKGDDYLMEEVDENGNIKGSASLSKTWKRLKGDLAKGFVPRGVGDRKIMLIDAERVHYEIPNPNTGKYERIDAVLPGGRTVADGTMWTSKVFMDRINRVSGLKAYVYKTYVRHLDHKDKRNYVLIKMLEVTPYNGMRIVDNNDTVIAEYKNGTWVASNGEQFDSVTTLNDEVKQARGIYKEAFKIHTLPEWSTKVMQVHQSSHAGSAHPMAAHTLSLDHEFYRDSKLYKYLSRVFEHYAVKAHQYNTKLYELLKNPQELRNFVLREIDRNELPDEFQLALRYDETGKSLFHMHFSRLLFAMLNRRLISNGLLKARPFNKRNGTLLHVKAGVGLGLERGEFYASSSDAISLGIALRHYKEVTGRRFQLDRANMKKSIQELNDFLKDNPLYVMLHRQPISTFANQRAWRMKGFVLGSHGPVAFLRPDDVFEILEGDFDGDEVHIEYVPTEEVKTELDVPGLINRGETNLTKALKAIENHPKMKQRQYQPLLDIFKPFVFAKSQADYVGGLRLVTARKNLFALQGSVTNARAVMHTAAWKDVKLKLRVDGKEVVVRPYKPSDRVVIRYWELDPEVLEKKHESGKTYRQLLEEQGARIIEEEKDGAKKYYLETTKEHEFIILLQAAVDNEKFGLFDKLKLDDGGLPAWLMNRVWYIESGSAISSGQLKMMPDNIEKIKSGRKTVTSRTYKIRPGIYSLPDGALVEITAAKYYNNISEMRDPEGWAIAEGYESLSDMRENAKFQHTKDFINGKRGLWVYKLRPVADVNKRDIPHNLRKYVSRIHKLMNYSPIRQAVDQRSRRAHNFQDNIRASKAIYDMFYDENGVYDSTSHDKILLERYIEELGEQRRRARGRNAEIVGIETNQEITPDEYLIATIYGYYKKNIDAGTINDVMTTEHPVLYPSDFYRVSHSYVTAELADSVWANEIKQSKNPKELYEAYREGVKVGREYYNAVREIMNERTRGMSVLQKIQYSRNAYEQLYSADYDESISDIVARHWEKFYRMSEQQKRWFTIGMLLSSNSATTLPPIRLMHAQTFSEYAQRMYDHMYGADSNKEILIEAVRSRARYNHELFTQAIQEIVGGERCG